MGADGREEDDGVFGMAEGAAGREIVSGGARRGSDADAIGLHGGEVFVIAEDFNGGHGWIGPAVDDDVVEDFKGPRGFVRVLVLAFFAHELFDEIRARGFVWFLGPHHGSFEAQAERDGDAVVEGCGEGGAEVAVVEFGEEAERAEGEGEHGRDDALEEPAGVEEGAVAAEGDADVEGVGMFGAEFVGPVFEPTFPRRLLRDQAVGVELLVVLQCIFYINCVRRVSLVAQQPFHHLPCIPNQRLIMCLGQEEDRFDVQFQLDAPQLLAHLSDPPHHIRQLSFGKKSRVGTMVYLRESRFVGRCVLVEVLQRRWLFLGLALLLEERVYETSSVLMALGGLFDLLGIVRHEG